MSSTTAVPRLSNDAPVEQSAKNVPAGQHNPMPPLSPAEHAALRTSIKRHGVLVPIVVDLDGNILDGHHRLAIATELRVTHPLAVIAPVPSSDGLMHPEILKLDKRYQEIWKKALRVHESFEWVEDGQSTVIEVDEDVDLAEVARSLNVDRRHHTAKQRLSLTAELRAKGTSIRGIATATGVSKTQVTRDIERVSLTGQVNPDDPPETPVLRNIDTVTGTDGKTYKASKPKKSQRPRKQTRSESRAHLEDLAARIRAAQPEAQLAACREACVKFIEAQGWREFSKLSQGLAQVYAEEVTVA